MGICSLRPILQSLCCNSPWSYAVFWKLKFQPEMILAWEDGFCDDMKSRDFSGNPIEDFYSESSSTILSSNFTSSLLDGNPGEYPIGIAVAELTSSFHVFGKGVVGEVAFTGNPRWIYAENVATDMFDSVLNLEYPDEWLLQFIAGIKTILLLPIIPHGVLQLGSVDMVPENSAIVAHAEQRFKFYKRYGGYDSKSPIHQFSLMSSFMENTEEPSSITTNTMYGDQQAIYSAGTTDFNQLAANQMMPAFMVQDLGDELVMDATHSFDNMIENESSLQSDMIKVAEPQVNHLSCENKYDATENELLKSFHLDEKVSSFPDCDHFNWKKYGEFVNEPSDFYFAKDAIEPNSLGIDFDYTTAENCSSLLSFPSECELHKALGPAAVGNISHLNVCSISGHNTAAWSSINDRVLTCQDVSGVESARSLSEVDEIEHLLEAIVTDACSTSDDKSNISKSLKMSTDKLSASSKMSSQLRQSASREEDTAPCSDLTSAFIDQGVNNAPNRCRSGLSIESTMSSLIDKQQQQQQQQQQQRKGYDSLNPGKGSRLSSTNKRKTHVANNHRPRPRDRQLIQDRIKELRELVPNTDKCSIDGLLDKTIKHMLFLRGVTDQADKLRQQVLKPGADEKVTKTAEKNCELQNGASWAVEIGSERQQCPIVVKDLDHPGHMLIEMLCADHGRFLEIADVIHRLQLTILKAVMEKCSENSWARFIVEASGSFQRLDIFWPLMQLLQQSRLPIGSIT